MVELTAHISAQAIAIVVIAVGGVGIALLWVGLRGRRVGDHPFCRTCGFDLFGRPEGSTACAECGAELRGARAMIVGVRPRRRKRVVAGVALLVPALVVGGVLGWQRGKIVDWQKQKPDWWLAREADSPNVPTSNAALTELIARLRAKELSKTLVARLVQRGLARQADFSTPWARSWGDVIEVAHAAGEVSDADWAKYAQTAVANYHKLLFRDKLRRRDTPPYELRFQGARLGTAGRWSIIDEVAAIEIDGRETYASIAYREGDGRALIARQGVLSDLALGRHNGHALVDLTLRPPNYLGPPAARVRERLPFAFDLVPDDQAILEPVADQSLRGAVAASLRVASVRMSSGQTSLALRCWDPPTELAFDVLVRRADGTEQMLRPVVYRRGERQTKWPYSSERATTPRTTPVKSVDVVFRPNPDAAINFLDVNSYWNEEVVLKDVPVDDLLYDTIADLEARERERAAKTPAVGARE